MTATARWLRIGLSLLMTASLVPGALAAQVLTGGQTVDSTAVETLPANPDVEAPEVGPTVDVDLGSMSEGDIQAIMFIVMMEAAREAREDRRLLMEELRRQLADADKLRELQDRMDAEVRRLREGQAEARAKYEQVMDAATAALINGIAGATTLGANGALVDGLRNTGSGGLKVIGAARRWLLDERQDLRSLRDRELEAAGLAALIAERHRAIQLIGRVVGLFDEARDLVGSSFETAVSMSSPSAGGIVIVTGGASSSSGGGSGGPDPTIDYGGCACPGSGGPIVK